MALATGSTTAIALSQLQLDSKYQPAQRVQLLRVSRLQSPLKLLSPRLSRSSHTCWAASSVKGESNDTGAAATSSVANSLDELKKALKQAVANTERGKDATRQQRAQILRQIEAVEACNPTPDPVKSSVVSGRWSLLYTAPVDEETADPYAGTEEGPFLSRVKPLSLGLVRQRSSTQVISQEAGLVDNIAEFVLLGTPGTLSIRGSFTEAPPVPGKGRVRIDVKFEKFSVKIGTAPLVTVPLGWINPMGWVDTTYLDEDLRIGRGDKGSVFVAARAQRYKTSPAA